MPGCAFGPCDNSKENGGAGCHPCDVIAKLPQQVKQDTLREDVRRDGGQRGKRKTTEIKAHRVTLLGGGGKSRGEDQRRSEADEADAGSQAAPVAPDDSDIPF